MFQNVVFAICRNKNILAKWFLRDERFWGTIRYSCFDWIPHLEPSYLFSWLLHRSSTGKTPNPQPRKPCKRCVRRRPNCVARYLVSTRFHHDSQVLEIDTSISHYGCSEGHPATPKLEKQQNVRLFRYLPNPISLPDSITTSKYSKLMYQSHDFSWIWTRAHAVIILPHRRSWPYATSTWRRSRASSRSS